MSSLQPGSPWTRAQPPICFLLTVSTVALLFYPSYSTAREAFFAGLPARVQPQTAWGGQLIGGRSHFNQSCGAACTAPVNASTGEILAPTATRAGQVLDKIVQAAEAVQGLNTIERALSGTELDLVEATLQACVAQAHADVNESYQQRGGGSKFENGRFPNDKECMKIVGRNAVGEGFTLAQELGRLKHAAAFACIKERLPPDLRENFTFEPRYKPDPEVNGVVLTNKGLDTLHPDFVVHGTRNATDVQCVYEFKFPCLEEHKLDPRTSLGVEAQLMAYQKLTKRCPAAIISPTGLFQLGISR